MLIPSDGTFKFDDIGVTEQGEEEGGTGGEMTGVVVVGVKVFDAYRAC